MPAASRRRDFPRTINSAACRATAMARTAGRMRRGTRNSRDMMRTCRRAKTVYQLTIRDRDNVLENRLFMTAAAYPSLVGRAHGDVEDCHLGFCSARQGDGDFGAAPRRLGAVDRDENAQLGVRIFLQIAAHR